MDRIARIIGLLVALGCAGAGCSRHAADPAREFNRGLDYYKEGKYAKAAGYFQRAIELAPPTAQALNFLGVCELYQGNRPAALEHLEQAVRLDADHLAARYNLGLAKLADGQADAAIPLLRQVAHSPAPPAFAEAHLADAYLATKQLSLARDALVNHLNTHPPTPDALNTLGVLCARLRDYPRAEDWFSRAIAADPQFAAAHLNLAIIQDHHLGRPQEALAHYQSWLNLAPRSEPREPVETAIQTLTGRLATKSTPPAVPTEAVKPGPSPAPAPVVVVEAPRPAPPPAPAVPATKPAELPPAPVVQRPAPPLAPTAVPPAPVVKHRVPVTAGPLRPGNRSRATAYFNQGVQQHQRHALAAAVAAYQKSSAADPTFAAAYYNSAIAYRGLSQKEKALEHYELAILANPDYTDARYNYAILLLEEGYTPDAVAQYETILAKNPNDPTAHVSLAAVYARDKATTAKAREHYQTYLRLSPNSPAAREIRRWLEQNR